MREQIASLLNCDPLNVAPDLVIFAEAHAKFYPLEVDSKAIALWVASWCAQNPEFPPTGYREFESEVAEKNRLYREQQRREQEERDGQK